MGTGVQKRAEKNDIEDYMDPRNYNANTDFHCKGNTNCCFGRSESSFGT